MNTLNQAKTGFVQEGPWVGGHATAGASAHSKAEHGSRQALYEHARLRMLLGKRLVALGFIICIAGIVGYCAGSFSVPLNEKLGGILYDNPGWLLTPTLGAIGLGTLLWLIGSFTHLRGAMDSDPEQPIL